jgi:hypothetical protein
VSCRRSSATAASGITGSGELRQRLVLSGAEGGLREEVGEECRCYSFTSPAYLSGRRSR